MGIGLIQDIPISLVKNFQLTQVKCEKDKSLLIDKKLIAGHLNKPSLPLYFLDFETIGYAIPQYDDTHSYQKLPFQYSLHVKPSHDSSLEHYEFLFEKNENPLRTLAERLINDIGLTGTIIAYNKNFEKGCMQSMADAFPDLSPALNSMIDRLWDLMNPFAKRWYCHPDFNGSTSIKKVLPVLVPDLSYIALGIKQGDEAQAKYLQFIKDDLSESDRNKIRSELIEYCKMDTFAMVSILDVLKKIIDDR